MWKCVSNKANTEKSGLPGLPGIVRKRLPTFSAAPLPWLVAPAIAGAEFDSSTKNEHETQHQDRLLFTKEGAKIGRREWPAVAVIRECFELEILFKMHSNLRLWHNKRDDFYIIIYISSIKLYTHIQFDIFIYHHANSLMVITEYS